MTNTPTAGDNVLRKLRYLGLGQELEVTRVLGSRVFGWPRHGDKILKYVTLNGWPKDLVFVSQAYHGTPSAFRERGVTFCALQVAFHSVNPDANLGREYEYEIELDHDIGNPHRFPLGLLAHAVESLGYKVTGRETDQRKVAELMDRRGIPA